MAQIDIQVPDIGDFDEVAVIELLVNVGDKVSVDQSLITVESDKASMEIPCSHAGVVTALKVKLGDKVQQGSVVLTLEVTTETEVSAAAPAPFVSATSAPSVAASSTPTAVTAQTTSATKHTNSKYNRIHKFHGKYTL
ncbi:MAG: hypothetical protein EBU92_08980 [Betaproteobacteria bacterium]|nr:hypothetical protein [Betaproteobacteria bacterium]